MTQYIPKLDKFLQVATLNQSKAIEPKGVLSRFRLTQVFSDYIYAHLYNSHNLLQLTPTVMFIMTDLADANAQVICVPFNMDTYDLELLEGFITLLIEQYPPEHYMFHMVMYSRFEPDHLDKEESKVMFCAKDSWGSRVSSVYKQTHLKGKNEMKHYPMSQDNFDCWLNKSDFQDEYTTEAVNIYHSLVSFKQIKLYT